MTPPPNAEAAPMGPPPHTSTSPPPNREAIVADPNTPVRHDPASPVYDRDAPAFDPHADDPNTVEAFGDARDEIAAQVAAETDSPPTETPLIPADLLAPGARSEPASVGHDVRPALSPEATTPNLTPGVRYPNPWGPLRETWLAKDVENAATWIEYQVAGEFPETSTYRPVDLAAALNQRDPAPNPDVYPRSDGAHLLYRGGVHWMQGETETGKTWVALAAVAEEIRSNSTVAFIDFEMSVAAIVARLQALGCTRGDIYRQLLYFRPRDGMDLERPDGEEEDEDNWIVPIVTPSWDYLGHSLREVRLVVVDGVTEAMQMHRLEIISNNDVAAFIARLRRVADNGPAVLAIDHISPKSDRSGGAYAMGAVHKLNGVDVAYSVRGITKPTPTRPGRLRLRLRKDRHGHLDALCDSNRYAADVTITPDEAGGVSVDVAPPTGGDVEDLTDLMAAVAEYLTEHADRPPSERTIIANVEGRTTSIRNAIAALIDAGYIETRPGPRRAQLHELVEPFNEPT